MKYRQIQPTHFNHIPEAVARALAQTFEENNFILTPDDAPIIKGMCRMALNLPAAAQSSIECLSNILYHLDAGMNVEIKD